MTPENEKSCCRLASVDVSVIVPVYRSENTLPMLAGRLMHAMDEAGRSYEIIFVEDAGGDASWEVIEELQRKHPERIRAVQLMRNFGQHNALMCGFGLSRGDVVVTMDDDLQHPPEEIEKLLNDLDERHLDVCYGAPARKEHASWRNLGSAVITLFYRKVFRSSVYPTAFRAIRRETLEAILDYDLNFTYIDGLFAWHTNRIGECVVRHEQRKEGRSGYSLGKLLTLATNLFTNFSLLPLQLVSLTGFAFAIGGFAIGAYYVMMSITNNIGVPGYASTITAIFVLGGFQLLSLGVIGEYLGRIHLNINRKPQYTIRKVIGDDSATEARGPARREGRAPHVPHPMGPIGSRSEIVAVSNARRPGA